MRIMKLLLDAFDRLNEVSTTRVKQYGAQYELFGIFAVINYIVPYFMWSPSSNSSYCMVISMRLLAGCACFLLIIKDHWHRPLGKYLPLYWHLTLLYCLPFLTTFLLFDSQGSTYWLLNMILAMLLLAVLVDWRSFIVILILGMALGYGFFLLTGETKWLLFSSESLYWASYMCFFSILIGILFSRRNEKIAEEKLDAYKYVSASIAHEMRTPLSSMFISAQGLQMYLPTLLEAYQIAQENDLELPKIEKQKLQILKDFPEHFISISRRSLSIIDIFLTKFGTLDKEDLPLSQISIKNCITQAIEEYPFYPKEEKELVIYNDTTDFIFNGSEPLAIHLFSNLLKNSLHQISVAKKGEIRIWISKNEHFNIVHFYDNASGIKSSEISKIFDRFYSSKNQGTGIGLAYCKKVMELFGGRITCQSTFGDYTEFQMYFPIETFRS
jgi:signal transduction histidine kinase